MFCLNSNKICFCNGDPCNFREESASATGVMGDRFLSSAGTGKNFALSMRVLNPSPALDKNPAPMGPEILSGTGAGVWRKAPKAFPDSSSVLDQLQSERASALRELSACKYFGCHVVRSKKLDKPAIWTPR